MFENLGKLKDAFNVYRAGQAVADEIFLKKAQLSVNAITVLLVAIVALLKAFNVNIPLDDAQLTQIAGTLITIAGLFNAHATIASTDKFGILPAKQDGESEPVGDSNPAGNTGMLTPPAIPDAVATKPAAGVQHHIAPGSAVAWGTYPDIAGSIGP